MDHSSKAMVNKQKGMGEKNQNRLHNDSLTMNFLNTNEKGTTAERHWIIEKSSE